ncbi:MAG: hypothetical protein IPI13_08540 [Actinomycetales bacterium]|uniref:CMP/dCMP-type deaminase domain-containing protein n=1 Tax=Candidatus Phosphoribacter hodrii TaxID=2953743 RepID=A0A935MHG4_9MICO|nr:hypothetical protein [Candidatus Phosphoribacter hodrii]
MSSSRSDGAGLKYLRIHAESNALLFADPVRRRGGWIAITHPPCPGCQKLLANSGLATAIWRADSGLLVRSARPPQCPENADHLRNGSPKYPSPRQTFDEPSASPPERSTTFALRGGCRGGSGGAGALLAGVAQRQRASHPHNLGRRGAEERVDQIGWEEPTDIRRVCRAVTRDLVAQDLERLPTASDVQPEWHRHP